MTNPTKAKSPLDPPPFTAERLLLFVTGSINAALLPYWLNWLRHMYPSLVTHVAITRSAERFVSVEAMRHFVTGEVWQDSWEDLRLPRSAHIDLEEMTDCFAVFPATLNTTMRLASGVSDTPTMLALQTTIKPIAIAPAFPGGNVLIDSQIKRLKQRPNLVFSALVPAFSVSKQAWGFETGFFLPLVLEALESVRSERAAT